MEILRRGSIGGVLCALAVIASFAAIFIFGSGKSAFGDLVALAIYLVICATYLMLLLAVRHLVHRIGDAAFFVRMRDFIVMMVISCAFFIPLTIPLFIADALKPAFGITSIIMVALLGVVSIRLAPYFHLLDSISTNSQYGKKAALWLKLSGWLMATVLLSFLGIIFSLVADYYMWRIVKAAERVEPVT